MKSREELGIDVFIGVLSSFVAASFAYSAALLYKSGDAVLATAIVASVVSTVAAVYYHRRAMSHALPGLRTWFTDRAADDYAYRLLKNADHSFEVMGATGSSVFVQSGKLLDAIQRKYEVNSSFVLRVLLVDPDAKDLIAYRKKALADDPNVMGRRDILATIQTLRRAREVAVRDKRQQFEVRTYDRELVWHVVLVDRRRAILGFYGAGRSGWKWPAAVFERCPRSFYYAVEEQFDQRWQNAKLVIPSR